jgi:chromosome segregation ATPase
MHLRLHLYNYKTMKAVKVTGIILLIAALLVSGGLYFSNNASVKQQQANQAQAASEAPLNSAEDEFDVFSEPIQEQNQNQDDEASVNSIPGIQGTSRQIIAIQQQIEARMINCVQDAQRAQTAVFNLRQQETALKARREALNAQLNDTDLSTPAGRERRDRLRAERERVNDQLDSVRDQLNDVRRGFSNFRSDCRRDISRLRTAQNRAESSLNRQFNDDTVVRFYN